MRFNAERAARAADEQIDADAGIEAGAAERFAERADATVSQLMAPQASNLALALVAALLSKIDSLAVLSALRAQSPGRAERDAVTKKLHGLLHVALLAVRNARQALVPAF
ncbi:MAG TPA: hypothetical protein VF292_08740 [Rhodanobacteraceae bacterium]